MMSRGGRRMGRAILAGLALLGAGLGPLGVVVVHPQVGEPGRGTPRHRLVVSTGTDVITVNPFEVSVTTPDFQVTTNLYDPLVELDREGNLAPALATRWARVSPTVIQLELRRGVKFHNGENFSAEDVKFTFDTLLDPTQGHKLAGRVAFIDRVEVIDPYTVRIVTRQPEALALRTLYRQGIVSAAYARAAPQILNRRPNGTGAYRFVEWVKDDHLSMEAFVGGWRGAPPIRHVAWRPIKEDAARVAALIAGEVDVAHGVPVDLVPLLERSPHLEVRSVASLRSYWLMLVNTDPQAPTAKRAVRQAINHAIDRDELNRAFFAGRAKPLATAVHPSSLGYDPGLRWAYDPERARRLLAAAGYPQGFTVGLHGSSGRYPRDRELAQAIAGQLAKVGITVHVQPLEVGRFTEGIFQKRTAPLVLYAYGDPLRDRTSSLGDNHRSGALWSVIAHPALDELIVQAQRAMDERDRAAVLRRIQAWMMENAPGAYLLTLVDIYGVNRRLAWEPRPDDALRWRDASLQP